MKILIALLLLAGCSSGGGSPGDSVRESKASHDCGVSAGTRYCIDRAAGSNDTDVFYFLHGIQGSEQTWSQLGFGTAIGPRTVVSLSFGPAWLLSDSLYPSALAAIPRVESLLHSRVQHRTLIGQSMGGFNSLQLLARNPELFERVALLCPAFSELSPFSSDAALDTYLAAHPEVSRSLVGMIRALAVKTFADDSDYQAHSPQTLQTRLSARSPRLFISAGDKDEFGFWAESAAFATAARAQGASVVFTPVPGGTHCQMNADTLTALAAFLR